MLNLIEIHKDNIDPNTYQIIKNIDVCFDCKLIEYPDNKNYEIINYQIWRSLESERNAILNYGIHVIGKKKINKMTFEDIKNQLDKFQYNYINPYFILYGVYSKRITYMDTYNNKPIYKSKCINKTFKIKYTDDIFNFLLSKFLYKFNDFNGQNDNDYLFNKYQLQFKSLIYSDQKHIFEEFD